MFGAKTTKLSKPRCGQQIMITKSSGAVRFLFLAACWFGPLDCSSAVGESDVQVTFYAMGDVPYAPGEDVLLPKQIENLPDDAEFVIHVGDIKRGSPLCAEGIYKKVAGMLSKSVPPVFIIPGDNEWNDCIDPDQAWVYWNRHFMKFDERWQHRLSVSRQKIREENFAFVKSGVLFVGLNIVGGRVHDEQEWKLRHAGDLDWVKSNLQRFGTETSSLVIFGHAKPVKVHDDFFDPFSKAAEDFGKPVLYLHGDGHKWIHDRPFKAKNILRVEVDQGGIAPPLKVMVTDDPAKPFEFDRRNGKKAS
jgi:hypothetical protein